MLPFDDLFCNKHHRSEYPIATVKDSLYPDTISVIIDASYMDDASHHQQHTLLDDSQDLNELNQDVSEYLNEPTILEKIHTVDNSGDESHAYSKGKSIHSDSTTSNLCRAVKGSNNDDDSFFEYPSDVSHYTLDGSKPLTEEQKEEHKAWFKEKKKV